ncbi:host-nuclease inhibitor Gam family protein [Fidelibacter multiformis]|jgi:phage host-nuclease inhibitor protein Gam|uniref:host-nuclease inhibitor Gam family protein n=1 Tax=Fidelibacter multiformis TaxID=3377529 RepID=UPI0037DD0CD2
MTVQLHQIPHPLTDANVENRVGSMFQADVILAKLWRIESRIEEIESLFNQELQYLNLWRSRKLESLEFMAQEFRNSLKAYVLETGKKSIGLPHGRIGFRVQPPHVEVVDEEKILAREAFVRVTKSPDKAKILEVYKSTGEIPDGVDIVTPEPKFFAKPEVNTQ